MLRTRIIPVIQLNNRELVKTVNYKNSKYLGDPLNAIKIFNEKRVDELLIMDISASKKRTKIDFEYIEELCSECFMPIGYGGGIKSLEDITKLFEIGVEKIIINSLLIENPEIVKKAIERYGSQSIVASIDLKSTFFSKIKKPYIHSASTKTNLTANEYLIRCLQMGVGEIIINDIDREGTFKGYDFTILKNFKTTFTTPLILNGGAKNVSDFIEGKKMGIDAFAAGSLFCLQQPHYAVLITYLNTEEIRLINQIKQ